MMIGFVKISMVMMRYHWLYKEISPSITLVTKLLDDIWYRFHVCKMFVLRIIASVVVELWYVVIGGTVCCGCCEIDEGKLALEAPKCSTDTRHSVGSWVNCGKAEADISSTLCLGWSALTWGPLLSLYTRLSSWWRCGTGIESVTLRFPYSNDCVTASVESLLLTEVALVDCQE